ncbi:hypothetical protein ABW21_db0204332 [Orbilia brochopaga]|nr:hypothetical protein ABW21_db0204332 [Drechslerella brochopaga]
MRIEVYPHVAPDVLEREIQQAAARELAWVIAEIMEGLLSLRPGLEECLSLLAPSQPGSTLVLSTSRSEGLKGFVTRVGSAIVKGVRSTLPPLYRLYLLLSRPSGHCPVHTIVSQAAGWSLSCWLDCRTIFGEAEVL